jgi:hypothetical protein
MLEELGQLKDNAAYQAALHGPKGWPKTVRAFSSHPELAAAARGVPGLVLEERG